MWKYSKAGSGHHKQTAFLGNENESCFTSHVLIWACNKNKTLSNSLGLLKIKPEPLKRPSVTPATACTCPYFPWEPDTQPPWYLYEQVKWLQCSRSIWRKSTAKEERDICKYRPSKNNLTSRGVCKTKKKEKSLLKGICWGKPYWAVKPEW